MRGTSLVGLGLVLGCALACSPTPEHPGPAQAEAQGEATGPEKRPSFDQRAPKIGDPAPAISLTTLSGDQVTLPGSSADRAAILIFGSFS